MSGPVPSVRLPALVGVASVVLGMACGGPSVAPLPDGDATCLLRVERTDVVSGEPVRLEVERVWRKDLVPDAFDARTLAPLSLRAGSSSRREDGARVAETWVFQAFAFAAEPPSSATAAEVVVRPRPFVARSRDGVHEVRAAVAPLRLTVRSALGPGPPGPPERPTLPPRPRALLPMALLGLALFAAASVVVMRRRRRSPRMEAPPSVAAAEDDGASIALCDLDALAARDAQDAHGSIAGRVAEVLRAYLSRRYALPADRRTTPEVVDAVRRAASVDAGTVEALAASLHIADGAKFSGRPPTPADEAHAHRAARAFVIATRRRPSGPPSA